MAIKAYGGRCACCGFDHPWYLTLDHINGDGGEHRTNGNGAGYAFYRDAIKDFNPSRLQVLCFACNLNKSNRGACTLDHTLTVEQIWASLRT